VSRDFLSSGHARALLPLAENALRFQVVEEIRVQGLSVRQTEARVAVLVERPARTPASRTPDALGPYFQQVQKEAGRFLDLPVTVRSRRQGAEMLIRFRTLGEMETLLRRIRSMAG
jgi:hypothetical protein